MKKILYIDKCKDCKHCGVMTEKGFYGSTLFFKNAYCIISNRIVTAEEKYIIPEWCELPDYTISEVFEQWLKKTYPQHIEEIKSNPEILHKILEE